MHTLQFVILGYLSGSILFARLFARLHGVEDKMIAESPDHNPGAFNAFAYGGILCGTATVLADLLKGILPVWLYLKTGGDPTGMGLALVLAAPVVGHIFPAFYSFRGGKGILCSGTLLLLLDWRIAAVGWGLFLILWLTTRYVSLGSVTGAVSFPITTAIFYWGSWAVVALSVLIAGLVVWAHRANIGRLLRGTESKFRWHKNAPGQP